jgi:hypothetical protein
MTSTLRAADTGSASVANICSFKRPLGLATSQRTLAVRVSGSSTSLIFVTRPENSSPGYASTVTTAFWPTRIFAMSF